MNYYDYDTMGDMGRFKFKLPSLKKVLKKLPQPPIPGISKKMPAMPFIPGVSKMPSLPGFAQKKKAPVIVEAQTTTAISPEVYAPSATAASQPVPMVTPQPQYSYYMQPAPQPSYPEDSTIYPVGTSPAYQTPSTPMVSMPPPSASVLAYDTADSGDYYTSPTSSFDTSSFAPENPTDSASYWGNESEMQGMGATTDTSWYQDLIPQITQAYVDITKAKKAAKTPATVPTYTRPPVTTQPGFMGMNLNTVLMVGAGGLGLFLLYNVMKKRRR